VAIARALLKDAPLVILDEPTSSLDPESEAFLIRALAALRRGRMVLVIAHRRATIAQADRIAVLDGGRLVEVGPYDALLHGHGPFARLMGTAQGREEAVPV
jgi:ABC-type multidrug transport system fused ATPase/permease subunit